MPYIKAVNRGAIERMVNALEETIVSEGDLNFAITKLLLAYLNWLTESCDQGGYAALNEVMGVLECVKQEFYRRVVVPYEETKREENGDVYE